MNTSPRPEGLAGPYDALTSVVLQEFPDVVRPSRTPGYAGYTHPAHVPDSERYTHYSVSYLKNSNQESPGPEVRISRTVGNPVRRWDDYTERELAPSVETLFVVREGLVFRADGLDYDESRLEACSPDEAGLVATQLRAAWANARLNNYTNELVELEVAQIMRRRTVLGRLGLRR